MIHIYGRMSCPYCVKAIELCKEQGVAHQFYNSDLTITNLAASKGHFTVPIVLDGIKFLGGYEELRQKLTKHNMWEKIKWWLVTGYHFFNCKVTYQTRINARNACVVKYLSGKGKDVSK